VTRIAIAILVIAARVAAADPEPQAGTADASGDAAAIARDADRAAHGYYDAHDYQAAITAYRRAYAALPDALFLFDIAQAYRQLHDCQHALSFYRDYLQARPDADNRDRVEHFIDELQPCAATTETTATAVPVAAAPTGSSHRVLQAGGIATMGIGAVVLGIAVYYSVQASNDASRLETACARGCSGAAVQPIDQAGQSDNRSAIASYLIGSVALASGAAIWLWARAHAPGEPPVVTPTPGGATVSARIRF
jgi:tetratricopeptide (TPR) repeat protein